MMPNTQRDAYRTKEELDESLFWTSFMLSSDVIFIHTREGKILHANPAAQEVMGYPMEELELMNIQDIVIADPAIFEGRTDSLSDGGVLTFRAMHRRKDGSVFEATVNTKIVEMGGEKLVVGAGRDITSLQIANMLNESLDSISTAASTKMDFDEIMSSTISAARKTLGSDSATIALKDGDKWTIRYYDGESTGILGLQYTSEESRSAALVESSGRAVRVNDVRADKEMNQGFARKFRIRSLLMVPLYMRGKMIGQMSFFYVNRTGGFTDAQVEYANKISYSVSLLLENARLYETEKATSEFMAAIAETAPSGTVALDQEGRIIFANRASQEILGVSNEILLSKKYNDLDWKITDYDGNPFPEKDLPFSMVMRTGRSVFGVRHAIVKPDGQKTMLLMNAAPLFDHAGKLIGVVVSMEDVTSAVLAEKALKSSMQTSDDIVREIPSGMLIFQFSSPDRLILTSVNPTANYMLGGLEGKLGLDFDEIWKQGAFFATKEEFVEVVTTGRTIWREGVHYSNLCVDGAFTFRAFCLPDNRLCVNFDDVTQRITEAQLRREAFTQIEDNIERFATLVDRIRNPLSAIIAQTNSCEQKGVHGVSERAEEIEEILKQLDRGWLESEKVRGFLKRSL